MKEIEVKAKIDKFEIVINELTKLGCKLSENIVQNDRIYLHNSIKFSDIKKGTVILRIRATNGKYILTLKKQLENELDNIEREVVVDNAEAANDILTYMDFYEVVRVSKKRRKCKYKYLSICIDEVEDLGNFIEVEKMTNEDDSLKVQEELFEFLEKLGVSKDNRVFQGYDTLNYNRLNK